jgi:hypothetical protein
LPRRSACMKGRCRPEPVSTTGAREYRTTHAYLDRASGAAREALETRGGVQRHQGLQTGGRAHARDMHIDVGKVPSLRSRPKQHQRLQTRVRARAMVMHVAVGRATSPCGVVRGRRVLQVALHVVCARIGRGARRWREKGFDAPAICGGRMLYVCA